MAQTKSVNELLQMELRIPDYQRPYKWDRKNIDDLLSDITNAIHDAEQYPPEFRYRIGTIILYKSKKDVYEIVDGQQRIISLVLLKQCLEPGFSCSILEKRFTNKVSQANIYRNYGYIREYFSLKGEDAKEKFSRALAEILEVVIICVDKIPEAFQLFDSQNTRGKALDPHDLLKAYHLREMKNNPHEMELAVTKWEAKDTEKIRVLFDSYLFPILNWSRGMKCRTFTAKEIDAYKGIGEKSTYTYAERAKKAMPYFQITEPFIAGNDFFEMVDHYMGLLEEIKAEICYNWQFKTIKQVLCNGKEVETPEEMDKIKFGSAGFRYAKNLFYCALLCYYDKFHNFDEMAVKKLFIWAFMLRVDMENLGYDSVNKYAIGSESPKYSNKIAMFSKIHFARTHNEIGALPIKVKREKDSPANGKWTELYRMIKEMNGHGGDQ